MELVKHAKPQLEEGTTNSVSTKLSFFFLFFKGWNYFTPQFNGFCAKSSKIGLPRENAHHITNDWNECISVKQTKKATNLETNRIRCKVLTQDGYANRLFLMKSSKGYIKLPYNTIKTSVISHYSASLVFQNNLATSAGKTKTKIIDHRSIGQFYLLAFLSLASSKCSRNAVVNLIPAIN